MYLLTEEWNEGDFIEPNFPNYHVRCYGNVSEERADAIHDEMTLYSPYDYCSTGEYDTAEEYADAIEKFLKRGCDVKYV